jgi:hypothetical protein
MPPPPLVTAQFTVTPLTGFPNPSLTCTTNGTANPVFTVPLWLSPDTFTRAEAAAAVMVSCWVPEVSVPEATVIVGVPAAVSRKKKLPAPLVIATDVIVPLKGPALLVSNRMVVELEERLAVPAKLVTGLLNASCTWKVTPDEALPATTVCAALVITTLLAAAGVIVSV